MTKNQKTYGKVALLMAGIAAASVLLTAAAALLPGGGGRRTAGKTRIVASFYPVYIAALNLTDGIDGVEVESLTGPTAGCLHDYQLSPANRIALSQADLLVINGAGAEAFLDDVLAQSPALPVIDTASGLPLLHAGEAAGEEDHADHTHPHVHDNEHIWTSPALYHRQVENLRDGLCRCDPENAPQYRENAAAYLEAIDRLDGRLKAAAAALPYKTAVTFHDSLAYMARDWGLTVSAALSLGEEAGATASDIARAEQAAAQAGRILLLYDSQYPAEYAYIGAAALESRALLLDTGVTGAADKNAWLDAMERNIHMLQGGAEP